MEVRLRIFVLLVVAALAAAVWTFPAWRDIFRNPGTDAAFPGLELELQDEFLALPQAERTQLLELQAASPNLALQMVLLAIADDEQALPDDSRKVDGAQALLGGDFQQFDALHWGVGNATIYRLPSGRYRLHFADFASALGANTRVYLAEDPQPLSALQLEAGSLDLGRLKGNVGEQSYDLPQNVDLSRYESVVIFCLELNRSITVATFR